MVEPTPVSSPSAGGAPTSEPTLRIALWCGLGPLAIGSADYWLWVWTGWEFLPIWGLFIFAVGCISVLVGLVSLGCYARYARSGPGTDRSGVAAKSVLVLVMLLANFPAAGWYMKTALNHISPRVDPDWVRARSYEFSRDGPDLVPWKSIGNHIWYFDDVRFGARYFSTADGRWVVLFIPDGDGPQAYALTTDRQLHKSPDDPASCGCYWSDLKEGPDSDFTPSSFESWPAFR